MVSPVMTFSLILTNHSSPESEVSCSDFNGSFDCDVDSNDRHSQRPTHSSQTVLVLVNFQSFTSIVDKESLLIIDVFGQSQQNNSFILSRYRTLRVQQFKTFFTHSLQFAQSVSKIDIQAVSKIDIDQVIQLAFQLPSIGIETRIQKMHKRQIGL